MKKSIFSCTPPTVINLAHKAIDDNNITEIIIAFTSQHPDVNVINLDNNQLTDTGAVLLSQHLANCLHLHELSVQFNSIGATGALALFSLKNNSHLHDLAIHFHGNLIFDVGEMHDIEQEARNYKPH